MLNDTVPADMTSNIDEISEGNSAAKSDIAVGCRAGGSLKPAEDVYPERLNPYMMMDRMRPLIGIAEIEYFIKEMRIESDRLDRKKEREQSRIANSESKKISNNIPVTKKAVKITKRAGGKGLRKSSTPGSMAKRFKQLAILKNVEE